ncbi:MAG: VPS10 domain-containing protein [Chloroflexota bacterium]
MTKRTLVPGLALAFGLGIALLSAPLASLAQAPGEAMLYQETFDATQAEDWQLDPGWQVIQEDGNAVLAGDGHHWARPNVTFGGDFRVQFRLKLLRGAIHLVYRLNNEGRYYIGFHQGSSNLSKQYWPDTFIDGLAASSVSHEMGTWHAVEIAGQGDTLRFTVNGQLEWEYTDPDPLLFGSFAFETLDDTLAYVDDIVVYGPPPPPTPTPDPRLTWVRTGGPLGGLGYDIRMRSDDPDTLYVTDAWAGVFKSTDGGQTWFPSNEGITTRTGESGDAIPVFCLTIDPHDDNTLWVGTQNVRGIYKSTDAGQSWSRMDNGVVEREGITFRGISVDPQNPDVVYAAAELSSWVWAGEPRNGREFDMTGGVVYKTIDGGQNWAPIWRGDNLARYVFIDPRDPDVLYLSTGIFDREAANSEPAKGTPGGEGVLKSTDGGATWAHANDGLDNLYVGTLFMHPHNPDVLLAGAGNNQYDQGNGVYLTTDGGVSWQQVLHGDNINAVEFAASDPAIAYAGSSGAVYRSGDGGRTWLRVSEGEDGWGPPGVRAGFPIDFQVDPRDANRIFANEYGGGNFVSTDGGRTWAVASAGYTGAQVRDIAVDPASGRVYAAARSGLFVSGDGGSDWIGLSTPPAFSMEWYVVAVDPADPSTGLRAGRRHVLAANNWNGVLLESRDAGQTWRAVSRGLGDGMSWRAIVFAPSDPDTVYAGASAYYSAGTFDDRMPAAGVFVSHDGGSTWRAANDAVSQDANVTALAVHPRDPQTVYAATGNHGLLKTSDGGASWTAINQGLPGEPSVLAVMVHPTEPDMLFAGLAFAGLYRSADGGATWQPASAGMNPEAMLSDVILDPTDPQVMFAADRFSGVYRSTDGGATWLPVNTGLRTRAVNELAFTADGAHLYAATEGEGVYRLDLSGQPPQPVPTAAATPAPPTATPRPRPTALPPTPTPEPTEIPTLAERPSTATPEPTATAADAAPATPTPEPSGGGFCGGAAALPLVMAGLVTWTRSIRKGEKR